ncbi:sigma-70 family RNA polymerase sigma factor (plasmid) [Clostridium perfringens]|uniref:sigma-70 family RNA polymerase sigma factor n=1 Tax=Clostridium perfringens TaxID=1502 RepID=UPI0030CAB2DC
MRDVKELEELLSSYRLLKVEINDLKLRELEEQINLKDEIRIRERKIARIDNAIKSLNKKQKAVIIERYIEGRGKQCWKLIARSLYMSERRCFQLKKEALEILSNII